MDFFVGQIIWVSFDFEIEGFMKCNGQSLPIMQNQALFSLIGTKYGGDGVTNFSLPNLKAELGSYQVCVNGTYPPRK